MNTTHNDPAAPMNVLYKHDRVGPTLMVLDALIPLIAGHSATHAADMTDELLSRGWYENFDDAGHYLVLNLDMLQLTPTPEGWDGVYSRKTRRPSHQHRDDGRGRCIDCEEFICMTKRPTFWEWFNGLVERVGATPLGREMAAAGYIIVHQGGGCLAWEKRIDATTRLLICDEDNGLGEDASDEDTWLAGLESENNPDEDVVMEVPTLQAAIKWCATTAEHLAECRKIESQP